MVVMTKVTEAKLCNEEGEDYESDSSEKHVTKESEEDNSEDDAPSDASVNEADDANNITSNAGWADSISKILRTKKPKGKKTLVLAKAKKLSDVKKKVTPVDPGFIIDGEEKIESSEIEKLLDKLEPELEPPRKKKKDLPKLRVKPNVLERTRERTLSKIATRGVVQLFNAVRNQQKDIDRKLEEAGPMDRKRENVLKSIDKRAFLDVLMGEKSEIVKHTKSTKEEKTWNVLRDDFMMGAKLKDWDKELENEELEEECLVE